MHDVRCAEGHLHPVSPGPAPRAAGRPGRGAEDAPAAAAPSRDTRRPGGRRRDRGGGRDRNWVGLIATRAMVCGEGSLKRP